MNATTRRLGRSAARITGPTLALLLTLCVTGTPAHADTPTAGTDTNAGTTWAQLMHRKLNLAAQSARLSTQLSGLRTTVTTRNSDLTRAQRAQTATVKALADATAAEQKARSAYLTARTVVATAKQSVTTARLARPRSASRVTTATTALTGATTTVRARAATVRQTSAAVKTAQTSYATATGKVAAAVTAYQSAADAVTAAQQKISTQPALDTALAAQAAALSKQVVTQARANFTTGQTTQVYGVTVNKVVAYSFQRMIDDAAKSGVKLSGGGFRTRQRQIELRTINGCPDVWTAPASSCRVPTAIPGRSLHELGLAIDITTGGKSISTRKSPAFIWLATNAGRYGFVNLPSEPWHWSITGG